MVSRFSSRQRVVWDRTQILFFAAVFVFVVIAGKLAYLQLLHGDEYRQLADEQNSRGVVLPARRGNIYARDLRTAELFPLAQNSTTYTIFADPLLIENESATVELLAPLLYEQLAADIAPPSVEEAESTDSSVDETNSAEPATTGLLSAQDFRNWLVERLVAKDVVRRELHEITPEQLALVRDAFLPGIGVADEVITINPTLIDDPEETARQLAEIIDAKYIDLYPLMLRKKVRYVKLASRIPASLKDDVLSLGIRGVGAIPEYRRVYPEGSLASQLVGFLNHDEEGVYGVEGTYERLLSGEDGLRRTQVDPFNRQITVGDITINEAQDGTSLVLTIDRAIQELVERELAAMVEKQRADSGQAIVMDPYTGAILALAHYPTFDPNDFGAVYEREELVRREKKYTWTDPDTGEVQERIEEEWATEAGEPLVVEFEKEYVIRESYRYPVFLEGEKRVIYANRLGEAVLALKAITEPYEPGSVFKPIVMASAIDAGEVTPNTRSPYSGPVRIDEYVRGRPVTIKNAQGSYNGQETMTEVIENSSNVGMTFVAQQLGRATFYDYLKRFGFAERTDIDLEGENSGYLENYTKWSESELITKAFGQGISINLIQLATAYSALANGGLLMRPHIVAEEIMLDGTRIITKPETVQRVIDESTSDQITAMLISSVQNGYAKVAQVDGYFIAGKTGTSQTYSRSGRALSDLGTTIAAFGGYAPATNPKFVLIVKIDRPRVVEWGAAVAGPVFQRITEELLTNYFMIPPKD